MKRNLKVLYIYNPASGKKQVIKHLDLICREIKAKFGHCDLVESKSREHFERTINEASKTYDYVFFSGGDGTFNMALNAIPDLPLDELPIYGFLPGGSTSDMAYNLNISRKPNKGIYDLLNSNVKEYTYGLVGEKRFIYVADTSPFNEAIHMTPQSMKNKFGKLGYGIYTFKLFLNRFNPFKLFEITINGEIYKTAFACISNSKEVGNSRINKFYNEGTDDYYLIITNGGPFTGILNTAYLFLNGVEKSIKNNKIKIFYSERFVIDTKVNNWDVDGEATVLSFPLVCGSSGKKIKILTNRD